MAGPFDDLIPDSGGTAVADAPASPASPAQDNPFADLIPQPAAKTPGPFDDLIPAATTPPASEYDPLAPENLAHVTAGKPMGLLESIQRKLSPLLGPTESQLLEQSIPFGKKDAQGNPIYEYKPLADRMTQQGLAGAGYLDVKPMPAKPGDSPVSAAGKAIFNTAAGVENSVLSPFGVMTGGVGGEIPMAGRIIGGAFATDMAVHIPKQLDQMVHGATVQEKLEGGLGAIVGLLTAGFAGTHALAGEHPSLESVIHTTRQELDKVTPPNTPLTKTPLPIDDQTLDGLVQTRASLTDGMVKGKVSSETAQPMIDHIDDTLLQADKDQVRASEERIAQQRAQKAPASEEAPPVTPEVPPAKGGTSSLFRQAQAEAGGTPEPPVAETPAPVAEAPAAEPEPITDPAMHQAAESQAQRIATQVTQGQGDIVREAAYNAAIDKARAGMAKGVNPSSDLMRRAAKEAAGKAAEKAGVSLDAEQEGGQPIANTVAAPSAKPENTEALDAMHSAIDSALPERDAKIMKARAAGTSMEDIGKEHGISKQAVSQVVEKLMPKIRAEMEKKGITKEDIATSEAQDWTQATAEPRGMLKKDFGEGGAAGGAGGSSRGIKLFKDRKMSELDRATGNRSAKLQRSFDDAQRIGKEVGKIAPDRHTQGGISLWIEAGGDTTKLKAWEGGAKGDAFRKAAKAAQSLTPEQMDLARKIKATFGILEQRGNKYEVLGQHRDNYVPHVWDTGGKPIFGGGLKQNFKFNKARTFNDFAEGDAAGFKPKTLEIGKLLPTYLEEMNRVIADRQLVEEMSHATAKDGRPLIVPRGRVSEITTESGGKAYLANPDAVKGLKDKAGDPIDTSDYKVSNEPALHDWRWEAKDSNGNPIFMRDDLALHPEAARRVNALVGKSKIREWANADHEGASKVLPAVFRGVDTAQSVLKREMFGLLAPFHQVQEGTHAIAHLVNPFSGIPKIDLRDAGQADAARHGLMLLPDRTNAQQYMEGVGGKGSFLTQAARFLGEKTEGTPLVSKAANTLANVVDGYQAYLFHQYIPGLKFKTYNAILERNMSRYAAELSRGEVTPSDVKLRSAEQTNAAYGHLNYGLLDRSPTMQHIFRLSLLAPDFLEARGRFVAQAIQGLSGSKVGAEQFKALATIAAVQAATAYTITTLAGNKWDPEDPFTVVHGDRRYGMRTVPADLVHMVRDFRQFTYNRVNPLAVKGGIQLITGQNYRGEKVGTLDTMEELLAGYIPITARQIPGLRSLTETNRQSPISPLEQLAGSLGVKVSRKSPINDTYNMAGDWMKDQKIEKKTGSYPVSKYQQLRYALEDGDTEKAKTEYEKLKSSQSYYQIKKGFRESVDHPFTQNISMDKKFAASLKPSDRAVYDLAVQKRKDIVTRFNHLH